jgi:hypothetical protein
MSIDFALDETTKEIFYANMTFLEKDIEDNAFIIAKIRLNKMLEIVEDSIKKMKVQGDSDA